jgi:quercetin dioxygenase-like cupin family protein
MKTVWIGMAAACLLAGSLAAQTSSIITMDQEPHHHLALHNDFVKVFKVEVAPGDSIVLHRHDQDTVAIAIGEQLVTIGIPGKPDVHQKTPDGQVRLQAGGYVHSTHVDGATPYHTIAVEMLNTQTNFHNVCASILPGQPMNCPDAAASASSSAGYTSQPLLDSDQTRVRLVRVLPGQSITIGDLKDFQLIVVLDPAALSAESRKGPGQVLHPGDFVWIANGSPSRLIKNDGQGEARYILFAFHPN